VGAAGFERGVLHQTALDGSADLSVDAQECTYPYGIAADESVVFAGTADGYVLRFPTDDLGDVEVVADGMQMVLDLALNDTSVYWTNGFDTVWRQPRAGGTPAAFATDQLGPASIVIDETWVYWTNYFTGTIVRAPLDGGEVEVLANEQAEPHAIVVNDTSIFWATRHDVMKLAK
jgi:hypothetical protein